MVCGGVWLASDCTLSLQSRARVKRRLTHAIAIAMLQVPHENARSSLKTVYEYNVMGFKNGRMGAINGMTPSRST